MKRALAVLAWLAMTIGCGVGDTVVLGIGAGNGGAGGDGAIGGDGGSGGISGDGGSGGSGGISGDGGVLDAGHDSGGHGGTSMDDAGFDAARPDAGPRICNEVIANEDHACSYAPRTNLSPARAKWRWPEGDFALSWSPSPAVIPLVANFTDDNADGRVDLCDTPDVVVTTYNNETSVGALWLLSGDDGEALFSFDAAVASDVVPALADLDADGLPEVVTLDDARRLIIFESNGDVRWIGSSPSWLAASAGTCHAIAVADLQGDGSPEILAGFEVFDSQGTLLFGATPNTQQWPWPFPPNPAPCTAPIAADLDRDGVMEVLFGHETYRANGELAWAYPDAFSIAQAINLDETPQLEVVLLRSDGIVIAGYDGQGLLPPSQCGTSNITIADTTGDRRPEIVDSICALMPFSWDGSNIDATWRGTPAFLEPGSSSAAFDFGARGAADVIGTESNALHVIEGRSGMLGLSFGAGSFTSFAYPVVVDVDNDLSADVLVVDENADGYQLVAVSAIDRTWMPTRKIWNQLAYVVSNVHEDASLVSPGEMRAPRGYHQNAVIEDGAICLPAQPTL